jgi:hypothetical protein
MTYTIVDFYNISEKGFNVMLPKTTVDLINSLSRHVGSPNYIKTPVFNKKDNSHGDNERKRRRKFRAQDTSWGDNSKAEGNTKSNIVFKSPLGKKTLTTVETITQSIRSILNKIGSSNTDEMFDSLVNIIDDMLDDNDDDITGEDVHNISENITNVMSSNSFYSEVYTKIYVKLIDKYDFIQDTLNSKLENYISNYSGIVDVNPDENYDLFCSKNKENDIRRANTLFYTNLTKNNKLDEKLLVEFIVSLCDKIADNIHIAGSVSMIDEMIENISIMILTNPRLYTLLNEITPSTNNMNGKNVKEYLISLSQTKPSTFVALSTKSLFKLKDTLDDMNV